jgi:hypothetical protein
MVWRQNVQFPVRPTREYYLRKCGYRLNACKTTCNYNMRQAVRNDHIGCIFSIVDTLDNCDMYPGDVEIVIQRDDSLARIYGNRRVQ